MPPTKRTNKAAEVLAENVQRLTNSDDFKAALKFRKSFMTDYTFRNIWLIWCQCPEATVVAGYKKWLEVGRQVRKGEKGLRITAPLIRKNNDSETEVFGFRGASVFDISQTDGESLPSLPAPQILTAQAANIRPITDALMSVAKARGIAVEFKQIKDAQGYFSPMSNKIVLKADQPALQNLKTLVHELAHAAQAAEVTLIDASVTGCQHRANKVELSLDSNAVLAATVVIAADGRQSVLRRDAGIPVNEWQYDQTALALSFSHTSAHHGMSVEYHKTSGP
ncbi:MAG: DUF6782 family putative metallopeptidase, partial [Deinococcota bacterium]